MSQRGSYNQKSRRGYTKNTKENFCGSCSRGVGKIAPAKADPGGPFPPTKEDFGTYSNNKGCNYSLGGEYSVMGNSACSCSNIYKGRACSCAGPCSCGGEIKEKYCRGCGGDYNVFNYDMVECYKNTAAPVSAIPALPPYYFTGNSKLTIEDPDNALTFWLGGPPCPCKSGSNQPAVGRGNWFNDLRKKC